MTLDATARATAQRLIGNFGKKVTIRRTTRLYSASTGKTTDTVIDSVVTSTPPAPFKLRRIDGTQIQSGDMEISVAAADISFDPQPGHEVVIDDEVWNVITVGAVWSGEKKALHKLQLRK